MEPLGNRLQSLDGYWPGCLSGLGLGSRTGIGKWAGRKVELERERLGSALAGLVGIPAGVGVWMKFSPVSLVTADLLGSAQAAVFGQVSPDCILEL